MTNIKDLLSHWENGKATFKRDGFSHNEPYPLKNCTLNYNEATNEYFVFRGQTSYGLNDITLVKNKKDFTIKIDKANEPIVPCLLRQIGINEFRLASEKDSKEGIYLSTNLGITKREYYAGLAMASFFGGEFIGQSGMPDENIAERCISMADALLKKLYNE